MLRPPKKCGRIRSGFCVCVCVKLLILLWTLPHVRSNTSQSHNVAQVQLKNWIHEWTQKTYAQEKWKTVLKSSSCRASRANNEHEFSIFVQSVLKIANHCDLWGNSTHEHGVRYGSLIFCANKHRPLGPPGVDMITSCITLARVTRFP